MMGPEKGVVASQETWKKKQTTQKKNSSLTWQNLEILLASWEGFSPANFRKLMGLSWCKLGTVEG